MAEADTHAGQWLPAARAGSREALGEALEACRGYLLTIAQRELDPALHPKGGASDIVQQTLIEAVRDFGQFDGNTEEELLQWLRRLLRNNVIDFAREYRETDKRQVDREVGLGASPSGVQGGGIAASQQSPSMEVMGRENAAAIQGVVAGLPELYRRVVLLRYEEQQSFEEIGRALDMTPNAARKLLLRAVQRVRQELEGSA
jgi:RNA polymerase sigma-70 factor (ECF subfamily)